LSKLPNVNSDVFDNLTELDDPRFHAAKVAQEFIYANYFGFYANRKKVFTGHVYFFFFASALAFALTAA
jgi:hypothetical protein